MKLYGSDRSNFASKCRLVISEKGLTAIEIVSLSKEFIESREFRRLNPLRKIPVLEIEPGHTIFESEVINEYLEERFPHPPLMPADSEERARVRIIGRVHDLDLEPRLRELGRLDPKTRDARMADARLSEINLRLYELEHLLGEPWAAGAMFTLADCSLAPRILYLTIMMPIFGALSVFNNRPKLTKWWSLIHTRPASKKVLDEQLAELRTMLG